jgi:hypothetical protein
LFEAINYKSLEMPPDGPLSPREIAAIGEWIKMGVPWPAGDVAPVAAPREKITDEDRAFWSFQPVQDPPIPVVEDGGWSSNPIDRFIYARLAAAELTPAAEADRRTLIRRLYFDLFGLPPSPEDVNAFLVDAAPDAYEQLVDRLLSSPRYGERWARHWLDVVRYGDSDGWRRDGFRPYAWRYRDYVVRAMNDDKPYDRFVAEQLAGDELAPHDPDVVVATGFLRHWTYEAEQRQVVMQWAEILDDITNNTGDVFLAMGMGCARCHDHKFDPILQKDYFRLQAFFAPMLLREELPATAEQIAAYQQNLARWEEITRDVRQQIDTLEKEIRADAVDREFRLFPQDMKDLWRRRSTPTLQPFETQMVSLMERKLTSAGGRAGGRLEGEAKTKWEALNKQLAAIAPPDPAAPHAMVVSDVGRDAPPTYLDHNPQREMVEPGFLSVLDPSPATIESVSTAPHSSGRRTTLARWIASAENPLTTRVIVNRIWQYHFGRGLVATSSDFGRLGEAPSHPELLDWLATQFVREGWSLKEMHRLLLTSSTYRQVALREIPPQAMRLDPDNRLLWRMNLRRLDGEQIRDAMLTVTGELDLTMGGPGADPALPRRSIFTVVMRNTPFPLMKAFDAPDGFSSTPHRDLTTTPTQALLMINGTWVLERAQAWADRLWETHDGDLDAAVIAAYRSALNDAPDSQAQDEAAAYLQQQAERLAGSENATEFAARAALVDFCHVLLNSSEFVYID